MHHERPPVRGQGKSLQRLRRLVPTGQKKCMRAHRSQADRFFKKVRAITAPWGRLGPGASRGCLEAIVGPSRFHPRDLGPGAVWDSSWATLGPPRGCHGLFSNHRRLILGLSLAGFILVPLGAVLGAKTALNSKKWVPKFGRVPPKSGFEDDFVSEHRFRTFWPRFWGGQGSKFRDFLNDFWRLLGLLWACFRLLLLGGLRPPDPSALDLVFLVLG